MNKRNSVVVTILATLLFGAGCSSSLYQRDIYADDDLYGVHDRGRIAAATQERDRMRRERAEARQAQWRTYAEGSYYDDSDSYGGVLADTYESAYARRLRGFSSATYRMPASYFDLRYGGSFHFLTAYDPASYNIIVMGDQAWVEPKYITSMFGSWGGAGAVTFGFGIYDPWYSSWGYNPYWGGWNYPGWSWGWGPGFNPWWGPGYWWDPYHWGHHPGWGGGHHHYPHPWERPNVVHRGQYRYAPGAGSSAPIGSGSFIDRGSMRGGYRNGTAVSGGSRPGSSVVRPGSSSGRPGSSSTYRGGNASGSSNRNGNTSNSTYRDRFSSGSSSRGNSFSSPSSGSSYGSGSSSGSRPTYSAPAPSGGGSRGGGGGRNAYGR